MKSFPRYDSMVLAFAGDSTITRFLAIRRILVTNVYGKHGK
jgi:hypothetical protein